VWRRHWTNPASTRVPRESLEPLVLFNEFWQHHDGKNVERDVGDDDVSDYGAVQRWVCFAAVGDEASLGGPVRHGEVICQQRHKHEETTDGKDVLRVLRTAAALRDAAVARLRAGATGSGEFGR